MVDISIIKANNKTYSVKTSLVEVNDDAIRIKILHVYEVKMLNSGTSFQKIKTVYDSAVDGEVFPKDKYSVIYGELMRKLSTKYRYGKMLM